MLVQASCRSLSRTRNSKNNTTVLLIALVMDKPTKSYSTEPLTLHQIHPLKVQEGLISGAFPWAPQKKRWKVGTAERVCDVMTQKHASFVPSIPSSETR